MLHNQLVHFFNFPKIRGFWLALLSPQNVWGKCHFYNTEFSNPRTQLIPPHILKSVFELLQQHLEFSVHP